MLSRIVTCLLLGALIILPLSCTKLPEKPAPDEGSIAFEQMPSIDSIPAEWGSLIAVSNSADFAHIFQMWFEDEGGNIRIAFYNLRTNEFQTEGRLITRSGEAE